MTFLQLIRQPPVSRSVGVTNKAKTDAAVPEIRAAAVPVGNSAESSRVAPRAATVDPGGRGGVPAPLPHVARHVVDACAVGGLGLHRVALAVGRTAAIPRVT